MYSAEIIEEYFEKIVKFKPYKYQVKVILKLLDGKNIILQVPTGAGKTWASIMPFLFAKENNILFPQKLIYSLPLRTLTNSIFKDVIENEEIKKRFNEIVIQTGEYSEDEYFEKNIIFSTIDQTLSNFLCFPLALSPRQANINAGALIGSYLVFDEFHLLDTELAMSTTIGMLEILGNLSRFCIMTATLSEGFISAIKENTKLNIEIITLEEDDLSKIKSLLPKENKKRVYVEPKPIFAQNIIQKHINQKDKIFKSIVICNRIENAQRIYLELTDEKKKSKDKIFEKTEILCLHSRFYDSDRKEVELKLKTLFGKDSEKSNNVILVATQVIEAGMDISCAILHTEVSPISSFLQRAGRCARFENEIGEIFIYPVLETSERESIKIVPQNSDDKKEIYKLNKKFLPYEEKDCIPVYEALKNTSTLDGDAPKKLIEEIIGSTENEMINNLSNGNFNKNLIIESWNNCKKNMYRETIRDIQSVDVILVNELELETIAKHPYSYQSISIFKWSLVSWLSKIEKNEGIKPYDSEDKLAWNLTENNFIENDEDLKFKLEPITTDFSKIQKTVYLNAKYFGYHKFVGLNWEYEDYFNNKSQQKQDLKQNKYFEALEKDTFIEHNLGLLGALQKDFLGENESKLDFAFYALQTYMGRFGIQKGDFIKLLRWMIILHDYGKLNIQWQKPMQAYQAKKTGIPVSEILAHTDYNPNDEKDVELLKSIEKTIGKRPAHASIGAFAFQEMIKFFFNGNKLIEIVVPMAIAKHHSVDVGNCTFPTFEIPEIHYKEIQFLMDKYGLNVELISKKAEYKFTGFEQASDKQYILYLFFVRILRLCDQKATKDLAECIKYLPKELYL